MDRKILCVCAALACAHGWAQDVPTLDEVVVTSTRVDSSVLDSPSSINVISAQQIADSGATDVSQVITGQPSAVVNDYGIAGSTKSVSLRGSTSSQVLVLLDGIRLNSSRDGAVDLSTIPMEIVDHIEIVRGGESALYGTGAIGGVINIITKKAAKPSISLSVTNGSYIPRAAHTVAEVVQTFPLPILYPQTPVAANPLDLLDSQTVNLSMAGRLGGVGLSAGGSFARAANGFTWKDTFINDWRRLTNAGSLSGSGFTGLDAPLFGGELSVKAIIETSTIGAVNSVDYISATAQQTDTAASGSLSWKTSSFFTDALTFDLKAFYRYDQLSFDDPNPPFPPAVSSLHRTHSANLDLTQKLTFSDSLSAVYGGSAGYDYVDSTNLSGPRDRLNVAGFLSLPISPTESVTITPSVRIDHFSDFAGSFSYSLGAVLRLSEESSLRASFASAYRAPTLNELYWVDPYEVGNPNLLPETSYGGEIGWALEKPGFSLDLAGFTRLLFDSIAWDPSAASYFAVNIGESLQPGVEIHGKALLVNRITLEARYTFIYSLILQYLGQPVPVSDDRRVPFVPMHNLSVQARYEDKLVSVGLEGLYVSDKYTDISNTVVLPGYFVANADLRFSAGENIAFTLALKNIFNTLYYTQSGFPMPPFSLVTGVSVKL